MQILVIKHDDSKYMKYIRGGESLALCPRSGSYIIKSIISIIMKSQKHIIFVHKFNRFVFRI